MNQLSSAAVAEIDWGEASVAKAARAAARKPTAIDFERLVWLAQMREIGALGVRPEAKE